MAREFITVPDELIEVAQDLAEYFEGYGYSVSVEKFSIDFPYTPTLLAKRTSKTVIVEVMIDGVTSRAKQWTAYGRSCSSDTRVAIAMPKDSSPDAEILADLRELGAGLYLHESGKVSETVTPADLAINLALPNLRTYGPPIRKALGAAFEQVERGQWREGFEEACVALEQGSQKYLVAQMRNGRIQLTKPNGLPATTKPEAILKQSMGQLKDTFALIQTPNAKDKKIASALKRVNPDRKRVAHDKQDVRSERNLRRNVGRQMWTIVSGIVEIYS